MPWVKLDDGFLTNPKVLAAGKDGRALIIAGLLFCARELTDGLIVDGAAPLIAGGADVKLKPTAERLVELGVWHRSGHDCAGCPPCPPGHFLVHDYLDWQPSAEEERSKRKAISEKRAAAGRKGAAARWGSNGHSSDGSSHADAMANEWQTDKEPWQSDDNRMAPSPSPVPPLAVTGQSVTSTAYGGAPDDDDGNSRVSRVIALAELVGRRDFEQATAAGVAERVPGALLRTCIANRRIDPLLAVLVDQRPDAPPADLVDFVPPWHPGEAATSRPPLTLVRDTGPDPDCPDCHGAGTYPIDDHTDAECDCKFRRSA